MTDVSLDPYVLELLMSRVAHDVISPVGAINNGIELMRELGPDAGDEALDLVHKSAQQANRRLRMFRYMYGAAGSRKTLDLHDMRRCSFDYFEGTRAVLEWSETAFDLNQDMPQGMMKAILCLLTLSGEMVTRAGLIKVQSNGMTPPTIEISVSGDGMGFRDGMQAALDNSVNAEDLDPRLIHAFATGAFIKQYGLKLDTKKDGDERVTFTLETK